MKGREGVRTDPSFLKSRRLQALRETGCFLSMDGLQINMKTLLTMITCDASGDVVPQTSIVETVKSHLLTDVTYNISDATRL